MSLTIGSSIWQTVGPERVDAVYNNPPPNIGLPQAIGSDHWNNSISTNVVPGFTVNGGTYHLNWSINNSSGIHEPTLTPDAFPASIDLSHWEFNRMFLDVSQTASNGQTITYCLRGQFQDSIAPPNLDPCANGVSTPVPEPSSMSMLGAALLLLGGASLYRRRARAV
jgi:hypothetical protein